MMLADLHIHSTYSDGKLTISEIVDFFGEKGFKIIAITDHLCEKNTFLGKASKYLKKTLTQETFPLYMDEIRVQGKRALDQYGMMVIPGIELTKNSINFYKSAHILALGIKEFISADGDVTDIINRIKSQDALAIAAHPVSTQNLEHQTYQLWDDREKLASMFDAWEVASGPFLFNEVMESGLPLIANSDFHHPKQIRSWKTLIDCELSFESMKTAIKKQDIKFTFYEESSCIEYKSTINKLDWSTYA
jgi:PHP family Zn ribbon phosphoesterase